MCPEGSRPTASPSSCPTESLTLPVAEPAIGLQNICVSSRRPHVAFSGFALSWLQGFSFSLLLTLAGCATQGGCWQAGSWGTGTSKTACAPQPGTSSQEQTHHPWHQDRALSEGTELSPYPWRDHHKAHQMNRSSNPCGVVRAHIFTATFFFQFLPIAQHPSPSLKSRGHGGNVLSLQSSLGICRFPEGPIYLKSTLGQVDPLRA